MPSAKRQVAPVAPAGQARRRNMALDVFPYASCLMPSSEDSPQRRRERKEERKESGVSGVRSWETPSVKPSYPPSMQCPSSLMPSAQCLLLHGHGPQVPSKKSRSFTPTSPLSSKSAGQSPFFGHGPQVPSKKSRSFTPTTPSTTRSAGQGAPGASQIGSTGSPSSTTITQRR